MSLGSWRGATAWLLTLALVSFTVVSPVRSESTADVVLTGKVLQTDPSAPKADVVVTLFDPETERAYSSQPTGDDGLFRVEGAPPGSYRIVVEAAEGAYLAGEGVQLAAGANRPVALNLNGSAPNFQDTEGETGDEQQPQPTTGKKKGLPAWAKWTIVGGIAVLALLAIDSVTEDEDEGPASPS